MKTLDRAEASVIRVAEIGQGRKIVVGGLVRPLRRGLPRIAEIVATVPARCVCSNKNLESNCEFPNYLSDRSETECYRFPLKIPCFHRSMFFLHVQNGIKSGALNLEHSYKYRPLDDYLIDCDRWQRAKQQLIERAGLEGFVDPRKTLKELDEALYQQYLLTDRNIAEGKNPHIKFKKNGGFTLSTPKQEESDAEPLQQYFPDHRIVPLVEVLATVNRFTHYVDELQHPQQRYHHGKPSEAAIYAGIIGIGCAIGLRRMMRISRGITEAELEHTVNWHFTLDGLNAASDRVVHLMDRLDLPNLLRRLPEQLHTSSDGQKFEVRVDSLNANYSFKYFGKEQGVAAYTFRDERDLLWYSTVFSAAERESAYVIDGLMHNEVVKSDIHSTDAFGFSELVFAVSHLLGFSYAPRFKNLPRQRLYMG